MPGQMDDERKERITSWLYKLDDGSRYSSSADTASHAHQRQSSWISVAASEESDFRTAYVGQAPRTEYQTIQVRPDIDSCHSSKSSRSRWSNFDFVPAKTQYTLTSASSKAPTSASVRSERNKALSKSAGNTTKTSRSGDQTTLRGSSDRRQPAVNHVCSTQPPKQIINHTVHVHIQNRQDESIETLSPTFREGKDLKRADASTCLSEEIEESPAPYRTPLMSPHEKRYTSHPRTRPSETGKNITRPGPVSVTRNRPGKLRLERCKNGSDHTDKSKKSRRSDLAKYIVGNYY